MTGASARQLLPRETLEAAAHWYVQLNDAGLPARERAAWEQWLATDISHRLAWEQMLALARQLDGLPSDVAMPTLSSALVQRRRAIKKLLGLALSVGALGALAPRIEPGLRVARADHRTAVGERRHLQLSDGSALDINTDTALDVHFGPELRMLRLWHGEILVQTAADPALRPFEVHTDQGAVRALGTRFSVRSESGHVRVAVLEDAVEIRPLAGRAMRLESGQQTRFSQQETAPVTALDAGEGAWHDGRLIAIERRLDDFLAELARHRPGKIRCAAEVAGLRLSGAFRLADTDAVLDNLAASLPIKLRYFTRYWVSVEAR